MSIERYYLDDYGVLIEHPNGEYVLHSDYARLKAKVERLEVENKTRQKDMELLFASYKQALEDIRRLHWDLQTAKEGKQS